MAFRSRARLLGATFGVAALAGASQLGLAYGLGILRLNRALTVTTRDQWTTQLAWVAWFTMAAAAIGGVIGSGLLSRRNGAGTRLLGGIAAGVGAAVVVPLTMQPARTAEVEGVHTVFVVGMVAAIAAGAGIFAGIATMSSRVARWSTVTTAAVVWVLALVSAVPALAPHQAMPTVRLGALDPSLLDTGITKRAALFIMPAIALILGILLGLMARRRGLGLGAVALAGLTGPALLTAAYLLAGPGSGGDHYETVPYWAAMTAAGAGVLGSVLAAVIGRGPADADAEDDTAAPLPPAASGPPLPKRDRDVHSPSAIAQAAASAAQRPADQLRPSDTGVFSLNDTPQPQALNTPPQAPTPITPLRPTAPAPSFAPPMPPAPKGQRDGEFVDWVSGLGTDRQ